MFSEWFFSFEFGVVLMPFFFGGTLCFPSPSLFHQQASTQFVYLRLLGRSSNSHPFSVVSFFVENPFLFLFFFSFRVFFREPAFSCRFSGPPFSFNWFIFCH